MAFKPTYVSRISCLPLYIYIVTFSEQTIIERVPKYIKSVLYYTRDQNKHSNRCNFCSSKVRHKI